MDLVIDANILFSILIKKGKAEEIIFQEHIHAFAPEFLLDEFQKYEKLIIEKTSRSHKEFHDLMSILNKKITLLKNEETEPYMKEARRISPDKKDAGYFAAAIKIKCAIWSNDKLLRTQNRIRIYNTEELMKILMI